MEGGKAKGREKKWDELGPKSFFLENGISFQQRIPFAFCLKYIFKKNVFDRTVAQRFFYCQCWLLWVSVCLHMKGQGGAQRLTAENSGGGAGGAGAAGGRRVVKFDYSLLAKFPFNVGRTHWCKHLQGLGSSSALTATTHTHTRATITTARSFSSLARAVKRSRSAHYAEHSLEDKVALCAR